jgi:hypothetical protein
VNDEPEQVEVEWTRVRWSTSHTAWADTASALAVASAVAPRLTQFGPHASVGAGKPCAIAESGATERPTGWSGRHLRHPRRPNRLPPDCGRVRSGQESKTPVCRIRARAYRPASTPARARGVVKIPS